MRLTELIAHLQAAHLMHGDLLVVVRAEGLGQPVGGSVIEEMAPREDGSYRRARRYFRASDREVRPVLVLE